MTNARHDKPLKEIQSPNEIPIFKNEDEEAEFWATHSLGEGYRAYITHERSTMIVGLTIRLPQSVRAELERRAAVVGGRPGGLARKLIIDGLKALSKQDEVTQ